MGVAGYTDADTDMDIADKTFRLVSATDADGNYVGDASVDRNSGVITIGPSTDFVTVIVQVGLNLTKIKECYVNMSGTRLWTGIAA